MTQPLTRVAALALSALVTTGIVAGANGLASTQYAQAERIALASGGLTHVAVQHVVVVGRRRAA